MLLALIAASLFAGAINSVAGGGTLLTFPTLLAFLPPVTANATSTLALLPGTLASAFAYRHDFQSDRRSVAALATASILGGAVGALLLTWLPAAVFRHLIPWLLLLSAVLFSARPLLVRRNEASAAQPIRIVALWPLFFVIGVYGGYFGAAMGIMTLGALSAAGLSDVHRMNGMKAVLVAGSNGVASIIFILQGHIDWRSAGVMAIGAVAGGYAGARLSRRVDRRLVQGVVIAVAYGLTLFYFLRPR